MPRHPWQSNADLSGARCSDGQGGLQRRDYRVAAPVRGITTDTVCHLEAEMVRTALEGWDESTKTGQGMDRWLELLMSHLRIIAG